VLEYVTATRDATGAACSWLVTIGGQKMVATAVGFFRHRAANGDNNQIASALGRAVLPPRARCFVSIYQIQHARVHGGCGCIEIACFVGCLAARWFVYCLFSPNSEKQY